MIVFRRERLLLPVRARLFTIDGVFLEADVGNSKRNPTVTVQVHNHLRHGFPVRSTRVAPIGTCSGHSS